MSKDLNMKKKELLELVKNDKQINKLFIYIFIFAFH